MTRHTLNRIILNATGWDISRKMDNDPICFTDSSYHMAKALRNSINTNIWKSQDEVRLFLEEKHTIEEVLNYCGQ